MPSQAQFTAVKLFSAVTRSTSTDGTGVDLSGYINPGGRNMKAILNCGSTDGTTPSVTVKLQDSTTTTAGDYTDISGAVFTAVTDTTGAFEAIHFITKKRYLRAVATFTSDTTEATFGVAVIAENRNA